MSLSHIRLLYIGRDFQPLDPLLHQLLDVRTPVPYELTQVDDPGALAQASFDAALVVFSDGEALRAAVTALSMAQPALPIIAVAEQGSSALAEEVLRAGASDFLALDDSLTALLLDRVIRAAVDRACLTHALDEANARYRLVTDNAADLIARVTPEGVITYISPACRSLLGYSPDELIGTNVRDLFHPDDLPAVLKTHARAIQSERATLTYRIRCKEGRYVRFETTSRSVRNPQTGEVEEMITSSRDVTERHDAQELLRASEERFARVFRSSPVAFMVIRLGDQRIIDVNESFESLFGYRADEVVGRTTVDLGLWRDLRRRQQVVVSITSGRAVKDFEAQFLTRTGAVIEGLVSTECVELGGEPCAFQIINDITERKRAEKDIRDSARFTRTTLDALAENIAILDRRGTIVAVNRAWSHCAPNMCWTAGIGEGTPYLDFCELATGPEAKNGQAIAAGIRAVMSGQRDHFTYEYACSRSDGDDTWFSVDVTPYPDDERYSVVVAHLDITARIRAERAQRASEERFRYSINNLPDAVAIYDISRRIRFANPKYLDLVGLPEAQVLGRRLDDLVKPDTDPSFLLSLKRAYETGLPQRHTMRQELISSARYLVVDFVPQFDETGQVYELLSISHDITEFVETQQAEQEQRTLAEVLRDTSTMLTSTLDLRTVMVRILDNVGRVVSHESASIMLIEGNSLRVAYWHGFDDEHSAYFRRERLPLDWPKFQHMMSTGQPMLVPDVSKDPDWRFLPVRTNPRSAIGAPIRSHNTVIGFLHLDSATAGFFNEAHADRLRVFADYAAIAIENAQHYETMRYYAAELEQRVEERTQEMQRAKEHVEAILNSRSDAVILTFLTGVVRQVNPAFAELFGYAADEVIGTSIEVLTGNQHSDVLAALNDVVTSNQPRRLECVMRRKNGAVFDADAILSPVQNGTLFGIVCSVRDISARKQMEVDLRRAYERERDLGELKSRFVSMASHEFRSPLSTILASSDMLRHYSPRMSEERRREHFDNIENTIRHLTRLIDDVLMLGKADAHRVDVHLVPTDLVRFFNDIALESAPMSGPNGSPVYFECSLTAFQAKVDRNLLRQIVTNLLSNAIKYSPQATPVYFRVACQENDLLVTVQDRGIGIPPKDCDHLFEAFHRGGNVENIEGTGLGLAIVLRAVKLLGGGITFESDVGVGTTFIVRVPLVLSGVDTAAAGQGV